MRWSWAAEALPVVLDAVVEASWLTVAYLTLEVLIGHRPAYLGPVELSLCVAAGILLARSTRRGGQPAMAAAVVAAMAVTWFLAPAARDAFVATDLPGVLAAHPGAWIAGLAVVRGTSHADFRDDDLAVSTLLAWGLPALAFPWLLAQLSASPWRQEFVDPAFVSTLSFVATGLLAVAVARLDALGASSGVDWRGNRTWLVVLATVIVLLAVLGLPLAALLGVPLDAALRGALGPVWVLVGLAAGIVLLPLGLVIWTIVGIIRALLPAAQNRENQQLPWNTSFMPYGSAESAWIMTAIALVLVAALLAVLVFVAIRLLPERVASRGGDVEEREIVVPPGSLHVHVALPHVALRRRQGPPRDAAAAYAAALDELRADGALARAGDETPAAHVRRLRAAGRGLRPLELLAADYQLLRYAARRLSPAEHRRAIERWRELRGRAGRTDRGRDVDPG